MLIPPATQYWHQQFNVLIAATDSFYVTDPPLLSIVATEPPASEGQFHGGVGGGSEEAASRLPLHWPAALRQAEETDRRVRGIGLAQMDVYFFGLDLTRNETSETWDLLKYSQKYRVVKNIIIQQFSVSN